MALKPFDGTLDSNTDNQLKSFDGRLDGEKSSIVRRVVGDTAVSALKGAIAVPETIVGLADIPTLGAVGRGAEKIGFRPKEAKQVLDTLYSPEQQEANRRVGEAEGFIDTAKAAIENPSVIAQTVVESLPSIGTGGVVARGFGAVSKLSPVVRGAIGEGSVGAGQAAESTRQQSEDGYITPKQAAISLASGTGTGIFGALGGKLSQKLGISDVDTLAAGGASSTTSKGIARRIVEGGISEGVFEELPQSVQEQIWSNAANEQPLLDGLGNAAALGLLSGGVMGAVGAGAFNRRKNESTQPAQEQQQQETLMLANKGGDAMISFPDGSVGTQEQVDAYINSLPEREQIAARASLLGLGAKRNASAEESESGIAGLLENRTPTMYQFPDGSVGTAQQAEEYIKSFPERDRIDARARLIGYGTQPAGQDIETSKRIWREGIEARKSILGLGAKRSARTERPSTTPIEKTPTPSVEPAQYQIDTAAQSAATSSSNDIPEPTDSQKDAGNYKKGHAKVSGLDISIENPAGSVRRSRADDPNKWENTMNSHYGYIKGVPARAPDKEHVDVYVKPGTADDFSGDVYVVNQNNPSTGKFDEPKVMIGFASQDEAEKAYNGNYSKGWKGLGSIVPVPMDQFKSMLQDENAFKKPVGVDANTQSSNTVESQNKSNINDKGTIRPIVERFVKRRAAASQINLEGAFDNALAQAKRLMNGESVAPRVFDKFAKQFEKRDQVLADIMRELSGEAGGTPAALEAKNRKARIAQERAKLSNQIDTSTDSMFAAIAKLGGINLAQVQSEWGRGEDVKGVRGSGIKLVATSTGKNIDAMAEALAELGYLTIDENGKYDLHEFEELFEAELRGDKHYTPEDIEAKSIAEAEERYQQEYNDLNDEERQVLDGLLLWAEKNFGADRVAEIDAAIASAFSDQPLATIERELIRTLNEEREIAESGTGTDSVERGQGTDGPGAGKPSKGSEPARQENGNQSEKPILESYTKQELEARSKAADDQRKADDSANKKAEASSKVNDFVLTGSDRPADQASARGAQDLFSDADSKAKPDQSTDSNPTKAKIEDFGEKLGGARKDQEKAIRASYSDEEIGSLPLSKIWPKIDVNAIEDKFVAAFDFSARQEIPTKPKLSYKVDRWVEKVKTLRDINRLAIDGKITRDEFERKISENSRLSPFYGKVKLLESLDRDQWERIGDVNEFPNSYRYGDNGVKIPSPFVSVTIDGERYVFSGAKAVNETFDQVKEKLAGTRAEGKKLQFEIRGRTGYYFINKKGDKAYTRLKEFESISDARSFLTNEYPALVAAWEDVKSRNNVGKGDVRRESNEPRTGEDYRKGKDVTPDQFSTEFGFRGVEFGNWVNQGSNAKERQGMLNQAYDALMDLSTLIGIPPRAISLEGSLGLAFGSRGKGNASAHFEPDTLVINLTKTKGAGVLAHEWFHALDNYFQLKRGTASNSREDRYITYKPERLYVNKASFGKKIGKAELDAIKQKFKENPERTWNNPDNWVPDPEHKLGVRPEVEEKFANLVNALNASPMRARSIVIDGVKIGADGYWSRIIERAARSFENYVISKMMKAGFNNDYLANVVSSDEFTRDIGRYPYLMPDEVAPVEEAFDDLFATIKTTETDKGAALFSRGSGGGIKTSDAQRIVSELQKAHPAIPEVTVVESAGEIPEINQTIKNALREADSLPPQEAYAKLSKLKFDDVEGVYTDGKIYIVAGNIRNEKRLREVFAHEAIGHLSVEQMLEGVKAGTFDKFVNQVGLLDKAGNKYIRKLGKIVDDRQPGLNSKARTQEIIALIAERGDQDKDLTPQVRSIWQRIMDGIKSFARLMFDVKLSDRDVRDIVGMVARYAKGEEVSSIYAQGQTLFSRVDRTPSKAQGDTFVTAALEYLARDPEFFQTARSDSKDIYQIVKDIDPAFKVERLGPSMTKEKGATRAWEITVPGSSVRSGYIYTDGEKVWIDVSRLQAGTDRGNVIYSIAADFAHNTGKVLIGDPEGLSRTAYYRRNEAMLSSALKHGTTRHLAPHLAQEVPGEYYTGHEKSFGESVRPLNWIEGDDVNNIKELVYNSYDAAIKNIPEIKDVIFNPNTHQFERASTGRLFSDKDFESLVARYYGSAIEQGQSGNADSAVRVPAYPNRGASGMEGAGGRGRANPYRAGSATLKRAALFNTFLRKEGREGGRQVLGELVDQLSRNGLAGTQLNGILYSRSPNNNWDTPENSKFDDLIYALQDKNIDLKRVSESIKKAAGDIADQWNAYLKEELYHGRTAKRTKDFIQSELEPLIDAMRTSGVTMADFEEYLWARHAEERNKQIAKINPDMPDGGSGLTTAEARKYLLELPLDKRRKYEALAKRVDDITKASRQVLVDYGLETQKTVDTWNDAYKNYVPLMREDMDNGFGNGTGQGYSVRGNASKRATGSKRAVVDILANIAQQREKNIIRGEKNRVSLALLGLAKLNPNTEFWKTDSPPKIKYVNETTQKVEEREDPSYKSRDNVIVARVLQSNGTIKEQSILFNESNERAMRMARSLKNLDQDQIGELLGTASAITRYFASINTQYNPIFGVINIARDVQGAVLNLSTTKIAGKNKEVLSAVGPAMKSIFKLLRTGKDDSELGKLFQELQLEGGTTGYRDMFRNAKERSEALKRSLDPEWWKKTKWGNVISANGTLSGVQDWIVSKPGKYVFDLLSDYNETLENAVRLAAYKVAIDSGISKEQSASIAKNLTVNFNRKGDEMGRQIGSLYAFFNASVQGTARIAETLAGPIGKKVIAGGLLFGVVQALMMAAAGFDDDEPPEFVRDRNVIIPLGGGNYMTIPMPLGFNVLPGYGRVLTEWVLSGFKKPQERFVHLLDMTFDMFNPIGNAGLSMQTLAPTVLDPLAALAENKDFSGRQIAKKDFNSLDPTPGFTRAKDTASSIGKGLSWALNALSGGTDYQPGAFSPTPDQIDYLIGQAFGGVGREAMKLEQTANAAVTGEELPTYKIPLLGRFWGSINGQAPQSAAFYNNIMELNKHENEIKGRLKDHLDVSDYKKEHPETALITRAKYAEGVVRRLTKLRRKMLEEDAPSEKIHEIDERITNQMKWLNDKVKAIQAS